MKSFDQKTGCTPSSRQRSLSNLVVLHFKLSTAWS